MRRYFIHLAYKGTNYYGWQSQPMGNTVQQSIEHAFSVILRQAVYITGAGRTDSGVHAKQMYAHVDLPDDLDTATVVKKVNAVLPRDIAIFEIIPVHAEAHARFDANKRAYEYHIHTRKNAFLEHLSWEFRHELDIDAMNEASKILLEYTDFKCFSKTHTDVKTFDCKIMHAYWKGREHQMTFYIGADRFLRNMVRAIVGTMIDIGLHKKPIEFMHELIASRNRCNAGFSVPPDGLYLTEVHYPYIQR